MWHTTGMRNTTDKALAASIADALEDGSYETISATDRVAILKIGEGGHTLRNASIIASAALRSAGINAHHRYRSDLGWHIKATAWA